MKDLNLLFLYLLYFNSLADYIAATNHRLDELKEQNEPPLQSSVTSHTSSSSVTSHTGNSQMATAQASRLSLNHNHIHNAAEVPLPQKAVPVDTCEVDALIEKFKSEVEVCQGI